MNDRSRFFNSQTRRARGKTTKRKDLPSIQKIAAAKRKIDPDGQTAHSLTLEQIEKRK